MTTLRLIADDLTGALNTAAEFVALTGPVRAPALRQSASGSWKAAFLTLGLKVSSRRRQQHVMQAVASTLSADKGKTSQVAVRGCCKGANRV